MDVRPPSKSERAIAPAGEAPPGEPPAAPNVPPSNPDGAVSPSEVSKTDEKAPTSAPAPQNPSHHAAASTTPAMNTLTTGITGTPEDALQRQATQPRSTTDGRLPAPEDLADGFPVASAAAGILGSDLSVAEGGQVGELAATGVDEKSGNGVAPPNKSAPNASPNDPTTPASMADEQQAVESIDSHEDSSADHCVMNIDLLRADKDLNKQSGSEDRLIKRKKTDDERVMEAKATKICREEVTHGNDNAMEVDDRSNDVIDLESSSQSTDHSLQESLSSPDSSLNHCIPNLTLHLERRQKDDEDATEAKTESSDSNVDHCIMNIDLLRANKDLNKQSGSEDRLIKRRTTDAERAKEAKATKICREEVPNANDNAMEVDDQSNNVVNRESLSLSNTSADPSLQESPSSQDSSLNHCIPNLTLHLEQQQKDGKDTTEAKTESSDSNVDAMETDDQSNDVVERESSPQSNASAEQSLQKSELSPDSSLNHCIPNLTLHLKRRQKDDKDAKEKKTAKTESSDSNGDSMEVDDQSNDVIERETSSQSNASADQSLEESLSSQDSSLNHCIPNLTLHLKQRQKDDKDATEEKTAETESSDSNGDSMEVNGQEREAQEIVETESASTSNPSNPSSRQEAPSPRAEANNSHEWSVASFDEDAALDPFRRSLSPIDNASNSRLTGFDVPEGFHCELEDFTVNGKPVPKTPTASPSSSTSSNPSPRTIIRRYRQMVNEEAVDFDEEPIFRMNLEYYQSPMSVIEESSEPEEDIEDWFDAMIEEMDEIADAMEVDDAASEAGHESDEYETANEVSDEESDDGLDDIDFDETADILIDGSANEEDHVKSADEAVDENDESAMEVEEKDNLDESQAGSSVKSDVEDVEMHSDDKIHEDRDGNGTGGNSSTIDSQIDPSQQSQLISDEPQPQIEAAIERSMQSQSIESGNVSQQQNGGQLKVYEQQIEPEVAEKVISNDNIANGVESTEDSAKKARSAKESEEGQHEKEKGKEVDGKDTDSDKQVQSTPNLVKVTSHPRTDHAETITSSVPTTDRPIEAPTSPKEVQPQPEPLTRRVKSKKPLELTWFRRVQVQIYEPNAQDDDTDTGNAAVEASATSATPSSSTSMPEAPSREPTPTAINHDLAQISDEKQASEEKSTSTTTPNEPMEESHPHEVPLAGVDTDMSESSKDTPVEDQTDEMNDARLLSLEAITSPVENQPPPAIEQGTTQISDDSQIVAAEQMDQSDGQSPAAIVEAGSIDGREAVLNGSQVMPTTTAGTPSPRVSTPSKPRRSLAEIQEGVRKMLRKQEIRMTELKKKIESRWPSSTAVLGASATQPAPRTKLRVYARLEELLARIDEETRMNQASEVPSQQDAIIHPPPSTESVVEGIKGVMRSKWEDANRISPTTGGQQASVPAHPTTPPTQETPPVEPIRNEDPIEVVNRESSPDFQSIVGPNGYTQERLFIPRPQYIGAFSDRSEYDSDDSFRHFLHDESMPSANTSRSSESDSDSESVDLSAFDAMIDNIVSSLRDMERTPENQARIQKMANVLEKTGMNGWEPNHMEYVCHNCPICNQTCRQRPFLSDDEASDSECDHFSRPATPKLTTPPPTEDTTENRDDVEADTPADLTAEGNAEPMETVEDVPRQMPPSSPAQMDDVSMLSDDGINNEGINGTTDAVETTDGPNPIVPMKDSDFEPVNLDDYEADFPIDQPQNMPEVPHDRPPTPQPPSPIRPAPSQETVQVRSPLPMPQAVWPPKNRRPRREAPFRRSTPRQNRRSIKKRDRKPRRRQTDPEFGRLQHVGSLQHATLPDAPPVVDSDQMAVIDGIQLDPEHQVSFVRGSHYEAALYRSGVVVLRGFFEGGSIASAMLRQARSQPVPIFNQPDDPAVKIAGGPNHLIILTDSGHVYTIGRAVEGQLGVGDPSRYRQGCLAPAKMLRRIYEVVNGRKKEVKIAYIKAGGNVTIATTENEKEFGCGEVYGHTFKRLN